MLPLIAAALLVSAEPPTYAGDVAAILNARCVACHRPGQAAPFPLTTYDEARRKARTIAKVVETRQMPPWPAVEGDAEFAHARRLSDAEIATLRAWADADAPSGDLATSPATPSFPNEWQLGTPDLLLTVAAPFPVPAEGRDIYRYFAVPLTISEVKHLSAIAIRSNEPSVVHHVLYYIDASGRLHERTDDDGRPGLRRVRVNELKAIGGWAVGMDAARHPLGLGHELPTNGDHVLQVHFHPDGKARNVTLDVGLYFTSEKPSRELLEFQLPPEFGARYGIDIPAGEREYEVLDEWTTPAPIDLVSVWAHAHQVCVRAEATATFPDGTVRKLLTIPHWDFNWQLRYDFREPVRLPAGTRVTGRLVYDNSDENPDNPNSPPKRVTWGEQTTDEMGSLIFNCVAADEADKPALAKSYVAHVARGSRLGKTLIERAKALDANGNGRLEKGEIPPRFRERLEKLDTNGDGAVSFDELDRAN
jgi:hypothetical protein